MRPDRTVIVIGVFLFIVGLAVAWNGYDYVQLERGWTLVISGTIAACAGLVLVALGLALRELRAIALSASNATLLLAKARTDSPSQIPAAPAMQEAESGYDSESVQEFEQIAGVEAAREAPAPAELSESGQATPLSWMVRSKHADAAAALKMPRAETHDGWLRQPLAGPLAAPVDEAAAEEEIAREFARELAQEFAPPPEAETGPRSPPEPEPEPEIAHEPAPEFSHEPVAHEPAPASAHEPVLESAYEHELELAPEPEPEILHEPEIQEAATYQPAIREPEHEAYQEPTTYEPTHEAYQEPATYEPSQHDVIHEPETHEHLEPHEPAPSAEPAPSTAPRPAIVGHYDAQGTHYTLYADGSIEAETPHGVYRFDSMAELKRFIEGQD
ncbi:hypothetical protein [Rhodoblastus sp.]|uniref:hypothetical protein n=1 Tax=Rhodoblastus sp. TaxID=1962975 RepID=UPI003F95746E